MTMTSPEDNLDDSDDLNNYDVYAQAYRLRDDLKAAGQIE